MPRITLSAASMCSTSRPRPGLDEERAIAAFLHAARLGIFELSWNVLCPGCGGVLDTSTTLKSVNRDEYDCALCATGYQPTLDEMVEVTFTVSRRVRRIAAHDPDELPLAEYFRQIFWGSGFDRAGGFRAGDRGNHARRDRAAARREGASVAAAARRVRHRVRPGDARDAVPRRQGRADARAAEPLARLRQGARTDRYHDNASRAAAAVAGKPHRHPALARAVDRRRQASRAARQTPAVPDRQAAADQPGLPRHLRHRHARRRSAAQDHQPDLPVHRPQRLDRALRAGRRPGRLRPGQRAFPRAQRDRRGRGAAPWSRPSATR